jgi:outer membrane biosynthesis protein TonB
MSGEKEESKAPIKKEIPKEEKQKTLPTPKPAKQEEPIQPVLKPEPSPAPSVQAPIQKKEKKEKPKQPDEFAEEVAKFFVKNGIVIKEQNIVKKNAEIEYVIGVPSVFGSLEHYCRAKNKKKLTDADISSAFVQGQFRKLPIILLSSGELNKKGAEVLGSLKGLIFYRLE